VRQTYSETTIGSGIGLAVLPGRLTLAEMSTSGTRKACRARAVSRGSQTATEGRKKGGQDEEGGTGSHLGGRPEGGEVAEERSRHGWQCVKGEKG
jgi:hypothetical protein